MKLTFVKKIRTLLVLGMVVLGLSAGSLYAQDANLCPFSDDEVVLYSSPSTLAKLPAIQKVWGCDEAQSALTAVFEKTDRAFAEAVENDESQKERCDYFASFIRDAAQKESFSESAFVCYFTYVDGVVLALDIPEEVKEPVDIANGLSLTYILNENPSPLDVKKLFKEGEELEIVKQNDKELVGKLLVKESGELKATIYFGGTKIKDMDKYVVVFASKEGVEKKLARFQETNAFVAERLDGTLFVDYTVSAGLFEKVAAEIEKQGDDDPNTKTACDLLKKTKSYTFQAKGIEDGVCLSSKLETADSETAQTLTDLANGGLAFIKLKAKNTTDLPKEALLGLEFIEQIEITYEENATEIMASLPVNIELMTKVAKLAWTAMTER
jgi:hypothetical protein